MSKPKLLFIGHTSIWDTPLFGAQLRSANLACQLSRTFDITYACPSEVEKPGERPDLAERSGFAKVIVSKAAAPAEFARWGGPRMSLRLLLSTPVPLDLRERISPQLIQQLTKERTIADYDAVWAHRSWHAEAALRAGFRRIVCDVDDFEHVIFRQQVSELGRYRRRPLHLIAIEKLRRYERSLAQRFARVVVTKTEDVSLAACNGDLQPAVVPNGVSLPQITTAADESSPSFLFVGILGYGPNIDGAIWFANQVLPLIRRRVPSTRFVIAGRAPCPAELVSLLEDPGVEIVESPDSLSPLYAQATAVVTPIRLGHGTRIKVLEALAYAKPLVTTTEAASGHRLVNSREALFADSPETFASSCVQLIEDRTLRDRLAKDGLQFVKNNATWERVGERAVEIVRSVLADSPGSRS